MNSAQHLARALGLTADQAPFQWQRRLLDELVSGALPEALDLPTGLGKTSVMAIWLLAKAQGAALPRRLVYVVDRRIVVDQATTVAEGLRAFVAESPEIAEALGLGERRLPISTLRGKHVDNREWLEDPAAIGIVIGTVDMIGSRLLFEGYGVSRKMRPYHAGLLGADTLFVLDEAHLVPPFESLLGALAKGSDSLGPRSPGSLGITRRPALLSLSATGRDRGGRTFTLADGEVEGVVARRLGAEKRLRRVTQVDPKKRPDELTSLVRALVERHGPKRYLVFCDRRADAEATARLLTTGAGRADAGGPEVELLVGGRRARERTEAAERLEALGFLAGKKPPRDHAAILVATSAGEVGVDLDADHMVCDLVPWERMIQRLGRVNRRGDGAAEVHVLVAPPSDAADDEGTEARWSAPLDALPRVGTEGALDASPGALRDLKLRAHDDAALAAALEAATTPAPLHPALTRAHVEAWAMTSLELHTGRTLVAPWLRGWQEEERPQTTLLWRRHLPRTDDGRALRPSELEAYFEAAPPHTSELLEIESDIAERWLLARARALSEERAEATDAAALGGHVVVAFTLDLAGAVRRALTLAELVPPTGDSKAKDQLRRDLNGGTIVLDARLGGLTAGMLTEGEPALAATADGDGDWLAPSEDGTPVIRFRARVIGAEPDDDTDEGEVDPAWRERRRFAVAHGPDGDVTRWLVVDKWKSDGATEDDRAIAGREQSLVEHEQWAERAARELGARLGLPPDHLEALALAARLHDEGKASARWQEAFNAPKDGVTYAKTRGPIHQGRLGGYRHELGSYLRAAERAEVRALTDGLRDLVLHLIVSHHGFARPSIALSGVDLPPSRLTAHAQEVAERFARLQDAWGPWGLAWWETLLRAADQRASRDNDRRPREKA